MIGDFFISILIFLVNSMVNILPVSFPVLGIYDYQALLSGVRGFISHVLTFMSPFFNVPLLLNVINFAFLAIIVSFLFLIVKFLINVLRGSGA